MSVLPIFVVHDLLFMIWYAIENDVLYSVEKIFQIGLQRLKLATDKTVAEHRLKKKKGQLFYLANLEKVFSAL